MTPRISIVIPVFNQAAYTAGCLEALASDPEVQATAEVIVVDNASTDETQSVLAAAQTKLPSMRAVHLGTNTGFSFASNHGAELARGSILVMLNNDTVPQVGWLSALENSLGLPGAGLVGPKLVYPGTGLVNHGGYVHASIGGGFYPLYHGFSADIAGVNRRRDFQALLGACVMLTADQFRAVGGFGDFGLEDIDLCFKIRARGLRVIYEPRAVVEHHGSVTLKNSPPGSCPPADLLEFNMRWPRQTSVIDDDAIYYCEDGLKLCSMKGDAIDLVEGVSPSLEALAQAINRRSAGDTAGYEAYLKVALAEWLGNEEAWQELVAFYIEQQQLPAAIEAGRRMVRHLGTPGARLQIATLLQRLGHAEEVRKMLAEILADRFSAPEDIERARQIVNQI